MQELNMIEVDEVGGAFWTGVGAGLVAAYIFESIGGAKGINQAAKDAYDYLKTPNGEPVHWYN
jgi:hypothetical protein